MRRTKQRRRDQRTGSYVAGRGDSICAIIALVMIANLALGITSLEAQALVAHEAATAAFAAEPSATTAPAHDNKYARQLARECDALIALAVRRPYGWAWPAESAVDATAGQAPAHKGKPRPWNPATAAPIVSMQPPCTPAAGLLLQWAGDFLDNQGDRDAATIVAHGCAASEEASGKVRAAPAFGSSAGGRDPVAVLVDRGPTRAALAMMLAVYEAGGKHDDLLLRGTSRAIHWLVRQQSPTGAWPTLFPSDGPPAKASRILRLDTSDYRDSTFALVLAFEDSADPVQSRAVELASDALLKCRLNDVSAPGRALWSMAYSLDGSIDSSLTDFAPSIDLLSSQYAMQTLLGVYEAMDYPPAAEGFQAAVSAALKLPHPQGQWSRLYDLSYGAPRPTTLPTEKAELFSTTSPTPTPVQRMQRTGTFGLNALRDASARLTVMNRKQYHELLGSDFTLRQQMAAEVCGLEGSPLLADLPLKGEDVEPYLQRHEADWKTLDDPIGPDIAARIRRLWILLVRAKMESWRP